MKKPPTTKSGRPDLRYAKRAPRRHAICLRPELDEFTRIENAARAAGVPITSWVMLAIEARLE